MNYDSSWHAVSDAGRVAMKVFSVDHSDSWPQLLNVSVLVACFTVAGGSVSSCSVDQKKTILTQSTGEFHELHRIYSGNAQVSRPQSRPKSLSRHRVLPRQRRRADSIADTADDLSQLSVKT